LRRIREGDEGKPKNWNERVTDEEIWERKKETEELEEKRKDK
jgi:hypothetical protein